jgi:hypothetical protein
LPIVEAKIKAYNHWHDQNPEFFERAKNGNIGGWLLNPRDFKTIEYSKILKTKI